MPSITSINGKQQIILSQTDLPVLMHVDVLYPNNWASADYRLRVWLSCDDQQSFILPLQDHKAILPSSIQSDCDVRLLDESIDRTEERTQFSLKLVDLT